MRPGINFDLARVVTSVVFTLMVLPGCATVFRGTSQTVRVSTYPRGEQVLLDGRQLEDGQFITVTKQFEAPRFTVDTDRPLAQNMTFDPDPWLVGDAALLLVGVVPGLVALGIDFGTGAWRNLHESQTVFVAPPAPLTAGAETAVDATDGQ